MAVKFSSLFFWVKPIKEMFLAPFGWVLVMVVLLWVPFTRPWWWVFLPLLLMLELRKLYLWWIEWDYSYKKTKWVMLEIIPPKEILTPLKAMEDFFSALWPVLYSPPSWREKWFEGVLPRQAYWTSFEIASFEGTVRFFIRVDTGLRPILESSIYAAYPEVEIHEVDDYTRDVPHNIPNEEWDVYGEDFILGRETAYPIKTYQAFFEPSTEAAIEEKRLDPIVSLLEAMSRLGQGEQFWLQFTVMSLGGEDDTSWKEEGENVIAKAARRPEKKEVSLFEELLVTFKNIIFGPQKTDKDSYEWLEVEVAESAEREMLLTPVEREVLMAVENKMKKPMFRVNIRGVYVAKRENWRPSNRILTRAYFAHFLTQNLNFITFSKITRPKVHYVFRKRIPLLRSRRMFRNYILRFPPMFPDRESQCAILNTEELATIYHFPIRVTGLVLPTMARVESKKSGPPPNLPLE